MVENKAKNDSVKSQLAGAKPQYYPINIFQYSLFVLDGCDAVLPFNFFTLNTRFTFKLLSLFEIWY